MFRPSPEYYLLPIAGLLLMLAFVGSLIAAFGTGNWLYLVPAGICYVLIAAK